MIWKCSPKLGFSTALICAIRGLAGRRRPPYITSLDSVVASSVQNCRSAQRYTQAFWALVGTHFSLWIASPGSSGMGNCTFFPMTNSLHRNAGISRTGEWLSSRNSTAQSMRANTSTTQPQPRRISGNGLLADAPRGQSGGNILLDRALDSRPPSCNACHIPCRPAAGQPGPCLSAVLTFGWGSGRNSGHVCLTFDRNGSNLCQNGRNVACHGGDHLWGGRRIWYGVGICPVIPDPPWMCHHICS